MGAGAERSAVRLDPVHLGVPLTPAALGSIGASIGAGAAIALPAGACGLAETAADAVVADVTAHAAAH